MPFFKTHRIHIYQTVEDAEQCGVNSYGLPLSCPVEQAVADGDYQPKDPSASWREFGRIVQGYGTIFLDNNVEIDSNCQLKIYILNNDGNEGRQIPGWFYVYGDPQHKTLFPITSIKVAQEYLK